MRIQGPVTIPCIMLSSGRLSLKRFRVRLLRLQDKGALVMSESQSINDEVAGEGSTRIAASSNLRRGLGVGLDDVDDGEFQLAVEEGDMLESDRFLLNAMASSN